ncbi:MAG TPA: hypothetical protein VG370_09040 [Chloroflexota bacterium]|jgi:hypothetical protein|nr:hypothetical protein [Chloroflexota bacterium]
MVVSGVGVVVRIGAVRSADGALWAELLAGIDELPDGLRCAMLELVGVIHARHPPAVRREALVEVLDDAYTADAALARASRLSGVEGLTLLARA